MDDHAHYFAMHRRINAAIVLDDAVAGDVPRRRTNSPAGALGNKLTHNKLAHAELKESEPTKGLTAIFSRTHVRRTETCFLLALRGTDEAIDDVRGHYCGDIASARKRDAGADRHSIHSGSIGAD
jgi:hypothetical protein